MAKRQFFLGPVLLAIFTFFSCNDSNLNEDGNGDTASDVDRDTDRDTASDTDRDTASDTDSDTASDTNSDTDSDNDSDTDTETNPDTEGIGEIVLDVPLYGQEKSNWCWATVIQMVLEYYGDIVSQCDMVLKYDSFCSSDDCTGCNNTGSVRNLSHELERLGVSTTYYDGIPNYDYLEGEIKAGRPILIDTEGHTFLVVGTDGNRIRVHNSSPVGVGRAEWLTQEEFRNELIEGYIIMESAP